MQTAPATDSEDVNIDSRGSRVRDTVGASWSASMLLNRTWLFSACLVYHKRILVSFWIAAVVTVLVMARAGPAGWDARGYWQTVQTVHHNGDPYAEGFAALQDYNQRVATDPAASRPFAFIYSPLTLPVLRLFARLPGTSLIFFYWIAIAASALLQLWAGYQMADEGEQRWIALVLPAIVFFPGLITDDVILSGNISYILYATILLAATAGWKRGRWGWYCIAVIAASVVKTTMLAFLLFPVLIDRRQRLCAALSSAAGLAIFAAQMLVWPEMFQEYLRSVRLVFVWLHDFGFGPASILKGLLATAGLDPTTPPMILYLLSASVIGLVLLFLSRRVAQSKIPLQQWVPVALVGTALLNPRIMKYDMAAITIPLLLIAVRALRALKPSGRIYPLPSERVLQSSSRNLIVIGVGWLLVANLITTSGPAWIPVELLTLLGIFGIGVWFVCHSALLHNPLSGTPFE